MGCRAAEGKGESQKSVLLGKCEVGTTMQRPVGGGTTGVVFDALARGCGKSGGRVTQ